MNVSRQSSFRPAHWVRIAGVCASLTAGLLLAPSPAAAQLSRAGATKQLIPGALLFGDVAHDPRNDVYLSVMAWGPVFAAFANSSGDVITSFTVGPAIPGGFANNPRVAYGPDLNGGAGAFLVTWHESGTGPNFVHSAVVSYPGGVVSINPGGVNISGGAPSSPQGGGPTLAYSPEAKKFLVTWTGAGWSIQGRLVDGVTGAPEGGIITVGPVNARDPAPAWNSHTQQFGVGYAGFGAYVGLVIVNTAGAVVAATGPLGWSSGTFNPALAVNSAGRYILGWAAPGGAWSLEFHSSGTPLASFPTLISSGLGTPTSFAFALNPVSGTILAVSEGVGSKEVPGVELSSSGVPLGIAASLTDGAGAGGAGGSYAPRVAARQTAKQWSISYARFTTGYALANQIVSTDSTDSATTQAPASATNPIDQRIRAGRPVTFTAAATGTPAPTVQWQVSSNGGSSFADVSGATATTLSFTVRLRDNNKLFRAKFTNSAGQALSTPALLKVRGVAHDLDGDGAPDPMVWRPSNGTFYWLQSSSAGQDTNATGGGIQWGNPNHNDVVLSGDIDGDGLGDLVAWRATTGTWYWLTSSTGYSVAAAGSKQWGNGSLGDVPLLADIDGDGKSDLVVWRATTGMWYWLTSSNGYSYADAGLRQWGNQSHGDRPLTGDFDGDGAADLAVWRAATGTWFWLTSSSGYDYDASRREQWGSAAQEDTPLVGDIDGDGRSDLVIWRGSTGTWYWLTSSSGYSWLSAGVVQWGNKGEGDLPLLTDFDGDGRSDLVVFRPTAGTGAVWFWLTSATGYNYDAAGIRQFGSAGDIPILK